MDIFVSHSSKDSTLAQKTCAALERAGLTCWIAPRDIRPGADWGAAIIEGIESSRLFVLVLTQNANLSQQVLREVERAVAKGLPIIPLRIEDVQPTKGLEFFISSQHWLDATVPPLEQHLARLTQSAQALLAVESPAAPPAGGTTPAQQHQPQAKKRMPLVAILALAVVVLLALPAAWLAWQYFTSSDQPDFSQSNRPAAAPKSNEGENHDPLFARTIVARFERWDQDGDGKLAVDEIRRFLTNMESARDEIAAVLKRLDADGDGALTQEEMLRFGQDVVRHRDSDGDGRFTAAEFLAVNRRDGSKATPATVMKSFRAEDADNDGFVTVLEMERAIAAKLVAD